MTTKLKDLFDTFLNLAASSQKLGINLIRIAILIIFVWIGGLKFWNYEAEGIVPFVANSPFMSFFYTKSAPEYKEYKLKEGEFNEAKHQWHVENNPFGSHNTYHNSPHKATAISMLTIFISPTFPAIPRWRPFCSYRRRGCRYPAWWRAGCGRGCPLPWPHPYRPRSSDWRRCGGGNGHSAPAAGRSS